MVPNELQHKLVAYMDAATELAESMRADLRKGDAYSEKTVLRLSQFKAAAEKLNAFALLLNVDMLKLN